MKLILFLGNKQYKQIRLVFSRHEAEENRLKQVGTIWTHEMVVLVCRSEAFCYSVPTVDPNEHNPGGKDRSILFSFLQSQYICEIPMSMRMCLHNLTNPSLKITPPSWFSLGLVSVTARQGSDCSSPAPVSLRPPVSSFLPVSPLVTVSFWLPVFFCRPVGSASPLGILVAEGLCDGRASEVASLCPSNNKKTHQTPRVNWQCSHIQENVMCTDIQNSA